jgi:hypothetical protein
MNLVYIFYILERDGLILAEKMLNWVQSFVEKMTTVKELSPEPRQPNSHYPYELSPVPKQSINPYPYNDDQHQIHHKHQRQQHQLRKQRQQQLQLQKEQRQLLIEKRQLEQQQRQFMQQIVEYPTSNQDIDLQEFVDEKEREETATAEEIENPRNEEIEKSAAPVSWRRSKRNPRCLHTCLKRGLLHPAQCHMLC